MAINRGGQTIPVFPNGPLENPDPISSPALVAATNQTVLAPATPPPPAAPRKQINFRNMARLATIPSSGYTSSQNVGRVVIYLPHLSEDIELPRANNYTVNNNLVMPDGLWIYQYTEPLEINLSFTLHAYHDLCPEGSNSLLDIAARLYSLQLPASNDTTRATKASPAASSASSAPPLELNAGQVISGLTDLGNSQASTILNSNDTTYKWQPACSLRLIQAGTKGFGVHCVGFVKNVNAILHGPWLQTVNEGSEFNLPSAITYRFTFVHNPSFTNTLQIGKFVNAFGPDVLARLFNTADLAGLTNNSYADVEDLK
jgi:hypothetical protein